MLEQIAKVSLVLQREKKEKNDLWNGSGVDIRDNPGIAFKLILHLGFQ